MTDTLLIDFTKSDRLVEWALYDGNVKTSSGIDPLTELSQHAANHKLLVWVPSTDITFTTVMIPKGQQRHLDQVIPSLLEDNLATDIDLLHFSVSAISSDGEVNVAIIEKSLLEKWLETLEQAGLNPHALLPDMFAIPLMEQKWGLQIDNDRCLLRTAPQLGHVVDVQNLSLIYGMLAGNRQQTVATFIPDELRPSFNVDFSTEIQGDTVDKLAVLPENTALEMSLLQGQFRPQSNLKKQWLQWRSVVILALIAMGIHLGNIGLETWQLNSQVTNTKMEIEKLFYSTFPNEKRMVNAKAQTMQGIEKLQSANNNTGFLMLLQAAAPALKPAKNITVSRINYEKKLAEIRLDIEAKQYSELEQLKNAIDKLGLNADLGSVSGDKGDYSARLVIRGQQ